MNHESTRNNFLFILLEYQSGFVQLIAAPICLKFIKFLLVTSAESGPAFSNLSLRTVKRALTVFKTDLKSRSFGPGVIKKIMISEHKRKNEKSKYKKQEKLISFKRVMVVALQNFKP